MESNNKDTFLARWLNNDLSPDEEQDFKKSDEYKSYSKIADYSGHLEVPSFDKEESRKYIYSKTINKTKANSLNLGWISGIAASILLLFGLFYVLKFNEMTFETGYGEQLAIDLPDGSEVRLNSKSSLTYNTSNWKEDNRTLTLKGEAYFKVKKGSLFTVNTDKGNIEVLGTQFNVNSNTNILEVKCYGGKVRVFNKQVEGILTQGKALRFIGNDKENWLFNPVETYWVNDESSFYNTPLSKVFIALENQFNIRIKNKSKFQNKRFTGSFLHKEANIAVKTVLEAMDIKYTTDNQDIVLSNE